MEVGNELNSGEKPPAKASTPTKSQALASTPTKSQALAFSPPLSTIHYPLFEVIIHRIDPLLKVVSINIPLSVESS